MEKTSIPELLQSACASIRLRLRQEVLDESIPPEEAVSLRAEILQDGTVRKILDEQGPDGWIGGHFHGYDGHEAGLRLLREKGLDKSDPCLDQAVQALEAGSQRARTEMGIIGRIADERNLGGADMILASALSHAGKEGTEIVQRQIPLALAGMEAVLSCTSVSEITETYKGKLVFKNGISWPSIYHLRLLAFTRSWRSVENQKMVIEAATRLAHLSPIPYIMIRYRSQLVAPAAFAMLDFNPSLVALAEAEWMAWFHRMELLARLGVVQSVPELQVQLNRLEELLDSGNGWFPLPLNHYYFKTWGAYPGLMLEPDWKSPSRRMYDLTFRSLLILKYSRSGTV